MGITRQVIILFMLSFCLANTSNAFADKDSMDKIILEKDIPFSKQVTRSNTIYVIQFDFNLDDPHGKNPVNIPSNCAIEFEGGCLSNGMLIGNKTKLSGQVSILCKLGGSFANEFLYTTWLGMNEVDDASERLTHIVNFCTQQGIELIIDTDLNISRCIEIYPGMDTRKHTQGPKIRGIKKETTININGEMDYAIKIVKNKSPLTSDTSFSSYSFYKFGYIKQLTFNVKRNIEAAFCIMGWWNAEINQIVIEGNGKAAYGILFPYFNQIKNVDFYASAGLNIHDIIIYNTTKYGIANYNMNGVPYMRLYNFTIEQNENGVLCNSAGWNVSEGSLSYNKEYGLRLGNDNYTAKSNVFEHVEFDGNGVAAIYLYRSSNNTYNNNHFVARSLYGKNTQIYSYYFSHCYINANNEFVNDRFTRNDNLNESVKVVAFATQNINLNISRNTILNPYYDRNIELSYNEHLKAYYSEKPERTMFREVNNLNNNIIIGSENTTKRIYGDVPPVSIEGASMNGYYFYNMTLDVPTFYNGNRWVKADGSEISAKLYGSFADKPSSDKIYIGFRYFCTDRQSVEQSSIDPDLKGIEIIYKGNDVWCDALGRIVE